MRFKGKWIVFVIVNFIGGTWEFAAVTSITSPSRSFSTASQSPSAETSSTPSSLSNNSSSAVPMLTSESTKELDSTSDAYSQSTTAAYVTTQSTATPHSIRTSTKTINPSTTITADSTTTPKGTSIATVDTTNTNTMAATTKLSTGTSSMTSGSYSPYITTSLGSTPLTIAPPDPYTDTPTLNPTSLPTATDNLTTTTTDVFPTPFKETTIGTGVSSTTYNETTINTGVPSTTYNEITINTGVPSTTYNETTITTGVPSTEYNDTTINIGVPSTTYNETTINTAVSSTAYNETTTTTGVPSTTYNETTTTTGVLSTTYNETTTTTGVPSTTYNEPTTTTGVPSTTYNETTTTTDVPSTTYNETTTTTGVPSTAYNDTTINTGVPSTTYNETTITTGVPSTTYNETTINTAVPSTAYNETTINTGVPSTAYNGTTTTTGVPSTTYNETTTTTGVPSTTYNETTTTTGVPVTTYNETTTTTGVPSTTYNETTTTTGVPSTTYNETTTTTGVPSTTYNVTTTDKPIHHETITTTEERTSTTAGAAPASSISSSSATSPTLPSTSPTYPAASTSNPTVSTTQAAVTTPEHECSNATIEAPEHGTLNVSDISLDSVILYACEDGYTLQGSNSSMCILIGSEAVWSTPSPTCEIRDCGPWDASFNNYVKYTTTTYGSTAVGTCNTGYTVNGGNNTSIAAKCLASGVWDISRAPPCWIIQCSNVIIEVPEHGTLNVSDTSLGSFILYACKDGYSLQGSNNSMCIMNGSEAVWSTPTPTCEIRDCGPWNASSNNYVTYTTTTYGSTAVGTCYTGYTVNGGNNTSIAAKCLANGVWDISRAPPCWIIQCSNATIEAPEHGTLNVSDISLGSVILYACKDGYTLQGSNNSMCIMNGSEAVWSTPTPTCEIRDCGPWNASSNNYVTYTTTTYGSTAVGICYTGYTFNGGNNTSIAAKCLANGVWDISRVPQCLIIQCDYLNMNPSNETLLPNVTFTKGYKANSTASFTCPKDHSVYGYKSITCLGSGKWSGAPPRCRERVSESIQNCPDNKDAHGLNWNNTAPGEIATSECKEGYTGQISRQCGNNGMWLLPIYNCVRKAIAEIDKKIDAINDKTDVKEEDVLDALDTLSDITKPDNDNTEPIYGGEITKVTSILDTIVTITDKVNVTEKQAQSFADIASNLLSTDNTESWQSISQNQEDQDKDEDSGASKILNVVSKYSDAIIKTLNSSKTNTTVKTDNLVLHVSKIDDKHEVKFPEKNEELNISCSFALSKAAIKGIKNYSAIVYRNISGIMSSKLNGSESDGKETHAINSAVISVNMEGYKKDNFEINITLGHLDQKTYTEPKCSFWNASLNAWSEQGCTPYNDTYNQTVCRCTHLTNFAILMSPWTESNVDTKAIDIISIVGCSISMIGLLVTVITHIVLWRYVRTDRVVLLMNLSVALILSYAVFVGGVDRTENTDVCTSIAVVLHYIYLVVFCLMLAEGIEIAVTLVYVFTTQRSRLKWMIPCAWLLPAVIVGISIGATELEGYGTKQTCWLSVDHRGLIWAFVAPALTIILVNFVLLIMTMKVMFGARSLAQKSKAERVRTGVRCLCILVPLMGFTWVIGIFYVNESVAWIQYMFAVCNSLQGSVIFLFHCLLNKQIRIAIQKKRKLYYKSSMASKQTSKTFSMPRISLSSNSLQNTDNSFGSYGSTGYDQVSSRSEKYELSNNSVYRGNYSDYTSIHPSRI